MIGASSGLTINDVSALYFFIFFIFFFSLLGLLAFVTSVGSDAVPFVNAFATSGTSASCFFSFFFLSLFGVLTLLIGATSCDSVESFAGSVVGIGSILFSWAKLV